MKRSCDTYQKYVTILKEELIPAMGCTEPIALAYAAAKARETLGSLPTRVRVEASGNIIKNVKSVIVPHTGRLKGIEAASAAGIMAGDAAKELQVISEVSEEQQEAIAEFLRQDNIQVFPANTDKIFDIIVTVWNGEENAKVRISDFHTNITLIEKNGEANTNIIKAAYDADGATNTDYEYFFWGMYGSDVAGITNISSSDAAKQDFNGKANTAAIIATPDTDDKTTYANMGTYCTKFNEMSGTYADWYIPAAGQLYEIYTNVTDINTALTNIGGTTFNTTGNYWSSSENSSNSAWYVSFLTSNVNSNSKDYDVYRVRFVRDI